MRELQEPICAELRSEMARQRLKIKDVARELGISPKRIERIVNNSVRLDFITTMRIAEVLDLNPIELYLLTKTRSQQ
jgi:plasmid maintenance system antidote protein VapI